MHFGGGSPFDAFFGGGHPGMGGGGRRERKEVDTQEYYDLLGADKNATSKGYFHGYQRDKKPIDVVCKSGRDDNKAAIQALLA